MVIDVIGGTGDDFRAALAQRAVWRLLVKGVSAFLPEREAALRIENVVAVGDERLPGLPVFVTQEHGFGLHLRRRTGGHLPEREIFVRGRGEQTIGSIGIVIVGSSPGVGTRVVDAPRLFRYARELAFETLFDPADAGSVVPAVQAARAVENIVFLDLAMGVGLCGELDPASRRAFCPLLVRFGERGSVSVQAYVAGAARDLPA